MQHILFTTFLLLHLHFSSGVDLIEKYEVLYNQSGRDRSRTEFINSLVDSIVSVGVERVDSNLSIPDIAEQAVQFGPFTCKFSAQDGHLYDVKTLDRVGNASMTFSHNRTYSIKMPLGFKRVTVVFDNYNSETLFSSMNGSLTAELNDITFVLDLGFKYEDETCSLLINSFTEPHFYVESLRMTGPSWFTTWSRTKMAKFIIHNFNTPIKDIMAANMVPIFTVILKHEEEYICKLINLFIYFYEQVELL